MPLSRDTDVLTVPYLIAVYKKHSLGGLKSHLSSQLTTKRMSVLCAALGVQAGTCTVDSIAVAIMKLAEDR